MREISQEEILKTKEFFEMKFYEEIPREILFSVQNIFPFHSIFIKNSGENVEDISALSLAIFSYFLRNQKARKNYALQFKDLYSKNLFVDHDIKEAITIALKTFMLVDLDAVDSRKSNFFDYLSMFILEVAPRKAELFLNVLLSSDGSGGIFFDAFFKNNLENNSDYYHVFFFRLICIFSDPKLDFENRIFFIRLLQAPVSGYKTKFGFFAQRLLKNTDNIIDSLFYRVVSKFNREETCLDLFCALSVDVLKDKLFAEFVFSNEFLLRELQSIIKHFLDEIKSENCKKLHLKIFFEEMDVFYLYKMDDVSFYDLVINKSKLVDVSVVDNELVGKLLLQDVKFYEKMKEYLRTEDLGFLNFLINDEDSSERLFSKITNCMNLHYVVVSRQERAQEKIKLELESDLDRKISIMEAQDGLRFIFSNDRKRASKISAIKKAFTLLKEISSKTFIYDFKLDFLISALENLKNPELSEEYVLEQCSLLETYAVANGILGIEKTKMSCAEFLVYLGDKFLTLKGMRTFPAVEHINDFFNYLASDDCKHWDEATLSSDTRSFVDAVVLKIYAIPGLCVSVEPDGKRKFSFELDLFASRNAFRI